MNSSQPIIVISGLPRSGTSLMMQMLEAGGIEIATDGIRVADADNPRGYYELERVKELRRNDSWLHECRGKAVKIISALLSELPPRHEYRIVFMERRLPEILASQKRMLERRGTVDASESDEAVAAGFRNHLATVKRVLGERADARTLYVSFHSVIQSPHSVAAELREFLERDLDLDGMVRVVDSKLYRHKEEHA